MRQTQACSLGLGSAMPLLPGVAPFGVIHRVVALQSGIPPRAGVLIGAQLPPNQRLDLALPLIVIAIVVPMIESRALLMAALAAGAAAIALAGLVVGAVLTGKAK